MDVLEELSKHKFSQTLDNLFILALIFILIYHIIKIINYIFKNKFSKIEVKNITISGITVEIECNKNVRKLAHQAWVELITRKVALPFDEDNDVIVEVYNSWYQIFPEFRKIIKELSNVNDSNVEKLISVLLNILNMELRSHLTKYQARFRKWYDNNKDNKMEPQSIQKKYPKYNELILDLKKVNNEIVRLTMQLDSIRRDR